MLSPTESLLSNEFLRDLPHGQSFEWLPVKAGVTKKNPSLVHFFPNLHYLSHDEVPIVKLFVDDT